MKKAFSKKNLREFGYLIAIGFPTIIGIILPIITGHDFRLWTLYFGSLFLILAILKPSFLKIPYIIWMFVGETLGWLNSRLILGIFFIFILLPTSFIMKIFKYDPLKLKKNKKFIKSKIYKDEFNIKKIF